MSLGIKIEDYEDAEGHVNWTAYHKAEENAGVRCITCGAYMIPSLNLFGQAPSLPGPRKCPSCRHLAEDKGEVDHDQFIRCPKCRGEFDPQEFEMYEVFGSEDEHDIICPLEDCDHEFTVQTRITYTFTSPPLVTDQEKT